MKDIRTNSAALRRKASTPDVEVAPARARQPDVQLPDYTNDAQADLYLSHLSEVAAGTGLDVSSYLPASAPPSWTRAIRPWYRALAWERAQEDDQDTAHEDSSSTTASTASIAGIATSKLAEDEELLAEMTREVLSDDRGESAGSERAWTGDRAPAGWRMSSLPVRDEAGWAILQALDRDLPSPAPAPPLAGVHEALGALLGLEGAPGPMALSTAIHEQGAPAPEALDALQTGFAPYPDFAHAASLQVGALQSLDVAGVEASASPVMRHAEGGGRWDPARVQALIARSQGASMPDALRAQMSEALGQKLPQVVIHTDDAAAQAAAALSARAFAQGYHVYFAEGAFQPGSAEGDELLAHELTHVVQYDQGRLADSQQGLQVSSPSDSAEQEAERAGRRAATSLQGQDSQDSQQDLYQPVDYAYDEHSDFSDMAQTPAFAAAQWGLMTGMGVLGVVSGAQEVGPQTDEDAPAMRGFFGDVWDAVSDGVEEVWDGVVELGSDALMMLVRAVAPDLADMISEGPAALIQELISDTVGGWLEGLLGDFDLGGIIETISAVTTEVGTVLAGVASGDAACCETFGTWMSGISDVITGILESPAVEAIKGVLEGVQGVFIDVFALVIEPQFELLQTLLGGAWSAITAVVTTVSGWFSAVRDFASDAWDWVCESLGFTGGEGGVWEWLKTFAQEAWASLQETLAPVIEPLKTIGLILVALSPLGMIYAAIQVAAEFIEVAGWLWDNWGDPDLFEKAHEELGHTVLPGLLDWVQSFSTSISGLVSTIAGHVASLATATLNLLGAVTGLPLLDMATGFVQTLSDGLTAMSEWISGGLTSLGASISSMASALWTWAKPIIEVCCSIALCIAMPAMIPVVLTGWAWLALPDCIKGPIIDLILDVVIGILQATPDLIIFGPLWLVLKPGILGFLEQVRGQPTDVKVLMSNKVARILTGSSLEFIFGFVKGFLKGIWEGITDPFVLAWMLFKGMVQLGDWLSDMAVNAYTGNTEANREAPDLTKQAIGLSSHVVGRVAGSSMSRVMVADDLAGKMTTDTLEGLTGLPAHARCSLESAWTIESMQQITAKSTGRLSRKATARSATAATAEEEEQQPQTPIMDPRHQQMKDIASVMWTDLGGKISELASSFGPAIQEVFSGGEGMSFSGLVDTMGSMWPAIQQGIHDLGGTLAQEICTWFYGDSAEGDMGNAIGWLTGTILFEVVLFYFTAGAGTAIVEGSRILKYILKFMDWTGAAMGAAFKALSKLGGFLLKIGKGIGEMLSKAGGAVKRMVDLVVEVGEKIIKWAADLLKVGGKGADNAAAKETAETVGDRTARETGEEVSERGAREAGEEAGEQGGKQADEAAAAAQKKRAEAMARSVVAAADLQNWELAVMTAALLVIANNHKSVHRFDIEREPDGEYTVWMIASRKKIADNVDLRQGDEDIPGYHGRLSKRQKQLQTRKAEINKEYDELVDELGENTPDIERRIDALEAEHDKLVKELEKLDEVLGESGEVTARIDKKTRIDQADADGIESWNKRKQQWADETLQGGRKLDDSFWQRIENARTPDEIRAAKAEIASVRAEIASSSRSNKRDLLTDLMEREAKLDHHMRVARAMEEVPSGGWTDEALEQRIISGGKGDVYANSKSQAQSISNQLENRARVEDGDFTAGAFHGPEQHRGSRPQYSNSPNTAPDANHINVKGTLDGQHFETHIYFPE